MELERQERSPHFFLLEMQQSEQLTEECAAEQLAQLQTEKNKKLVL
jgi:hypothetical protein